MATTTTERPRHTPGPWTIFENGDIGSASVRTPDTLVIAAGQVRGATIGEAMANARLIAAAPELLAACEEFVRKVESGKARSRRSYAEMKAALAKVREEVAS